MRKMVGQPFSGLSLVVFCLLLTSAAFAERILPPQAQRGTLQSQQYPLLQIGGAAYRLAPGAKIFDRANRIILPAAFTAPAEVLFVTDVNGDLAKVWILTPEEQARLDAATQ